MRIAFPQFVRVMQHMASDLGFFGVVWGILVLAFSAAMLGAGLRHGASYELGESAAQLQAAKADGLGTAQPNACGQPSSPDQSESVEPWKNWVLWWFVRTYLQSLGQVSRGNNGKLLSLCFKFCFCFGLHREYWWKVTELFCSIFVVDSWYPKCFYC